MSQAQRPYPYNLYFSAFGEDSKHNADELCEIIDTVSERLTPRERKVLMLHFRDGLSYQQTGIRIDDVCAQRAMQIANRALRKIRRSPNKYAFDNGVEAYLCRKVSDKDGIAVLQLSTIAHNALIRGGYETVGDARKLINTYPKEAFVKTSIVRNFGKKCYYELVSKFEKIDI